MKVVYNNKADCLYKFINESELTDCSFLAERCSKDNLNEILRLMPEVTVTEIRHCTDGKFEEPDHNTIVNLPEYYVIKLDEKMDEQITAHLKVFLPVKWNERFMGMTGAASYTEFSPIATAHTNIISWPIALVNGFACATTDGGIGVSLDFKWGFNEDGSVQENRIDSWNLKALHDMTMIAKVLVTILYGKAPVKSYIQGGSGGGKQVLAEVQNYPDDYDGFWADGPALDYYRIAFTSIWPQVVMLNEDHIVRTGKFKAAYKKALEVWGYKPYVFDSKTLASRRFLQTLAGLETEDGVITEEDINVMAKIWDGPRDRSGIQMAAGFGPNLISWQCNEHPFGYIHFDENGEMVPFIIAIQTLRWFVHDPDWDWKSLTYDEYERIFHESFEQYGRISMLDADLREFAAKGKKLIITHGTSDNMVPFQDSLDYYEDALEYFGSEQEMNHHFMMFMPEGAGHVVFNWDGANVTTAGTMKVLMDWVEKNEAPIAIETACYDFETETIYNRGVVEPFNDWQYHKYIEKKKMCISDLLAK